MWPLLEPCQGLGTISLMSVLWMNITEGSPDYPRSREGEETERLLMTPDSCQLKKKSRLEEG